MEIFNVHIFEFLMIAGLALVVFGPERLPEVGRFVGKQVARVLAWQQQSPEARMIQDIRQEFEQEIVSLRDELVRTRQQIDVSQEVKLIDEQTKALLQGKQPLNVRPAAGLQTAAVAPNKILTPAEAEATAPPPEPTVEAPDQLVDIEGTPLSSEPTVETSTNGVIAEAELVELQAQIAELKTQNSELKTQNSEQADRQLLLRQVHMLMADLHALTVELQERGLLEPDWQAPSQMANQERMAR
jgi:sec-independent protein translocase protein TatB